MTSPYQSPEDFLRSRGRIPTVQDSQQVISPEDYIRSRNAPDPYAEDSDGDEDEGVFQYFGNMMKYAKNLIFDSPYGGYSGLAQQGENILATGKEVGKDMLRTGKDVTSFLFPGKAKLWEELRDFSIKDLSKSTFQALDSMLEHASVGGLVKGITEFTVGSFLEAVSGTKRIGDTPVIATPTERAQAIENVASIYAMGFGYKRTASAIANKLAPVGRKALVEQGVTKTLAKAMLTSSTAGAASGALGGIVMNIGQDEILAKTTAMTLAGIPLGIFPGTLFEYIRAKNINMKAYGAAIEAQEKLLQKEILQDMSAAHGLAFAESKPLGDMISAIDAISSADNLSEAVVRSHVAQGKGWIVPNVSEGQAAKILSGVIEPSTPKPPIDWVNAPRQLKTSNPTFKGVKVGWQSNFDKAAYILSSTSKTKAKNFKLFADAVAKEFGISLDDMIAHGNYVRQSLKNMIAGGKIERLTQDEYDAIVRGMEQRGQGIIDRIPEGGSIQDYTGAEWVRAGSVMKSGEVSYPIDDQSLLRTLGRDVKSFIDPSTGKVNLPQLEFRPDFRRVVGDYFTYKHATGVGEADLLVSPKPLAKNHAKFFESTGFLPGEVVVLDGTADVRILQRGAKPNSFLVSSVRGKKGNKVIDASRLIHKPDGIVSAIEGLEFFESTPQSVFEQHFKNFSKAFNDNLLLDPDKQAPFDRLFEDARLKSGIPESQRQALKLATYRRLQDDFISKLDDNERIPLEAIRGEIERFEDIAMEQKTNAILSFTTGKGLYVNNKGGGQFEIREAATDQLINTFGDFDSAIEYLRKTYHNPLYSLDIEGKLPVPSAVADLGGYADEWSGPEQNKWLGPKIERFEIGTGKLITPAQDALHSFAAVLDDAFGTGRKFQLALSEIVRAGQDAGINKRAFSTFEYKKIVPFYKKLQKIIKNLSRDSNERVLGYIETMSVEEIQSGLLGRPANGLEISKAAEYAQKARSSGFSMQDVSDAISAARKVGEFGTQEYEATLMGFVKNGMTKGNNKTRLHMQAAQIAIDIGKLKGAPLTGQQEFSGYLTLRLSDAYQFPELALNKDQYLSKHDLNPLELEAAALFKKIMDDAAKVAGIPSREMIHAYVPHIRLLKELSAFAETNLPEDFVRGLTRVTIGDNRSMVRDPLTLIYRYLDELANTKATTKYKGQELTFNQFFTKAQADIETLSSELAELESKATGKVNIGKASIKIFNQHLNELYGVSDEAVQIKNFMRVFYNSLFESLGADVATNLIAMSTQGGRPIMAVRDFVSAGGASYTLFGHDFTKKAIFSTIPKNVVEGLERQGKIRIVGTADMISPSAVRLSEGFEGQIARASDKALELSGQHFVYRQRMAGIYLATEDLVNKWAPQLQRRQVSKKMFMDRMMVDVHPRAVQNRFDQFISSGDIEGATQYLAQHNIKRIMNLYGYANSPLGWTSSVGKLLGQYGSWGANNFATASNSVRNFSSAAGVKRMLRWTAYEGALRLASTKTGLNLKSWTIFPFAAIPNVAPAQQAMDDITRIFGDLMSPNPNEQWNALQAAYRTLPFTTGTETGRLYLPYSVLLQDILQGLVTYPEEGFSPLQQTARVFGVRSMEPQ